MIYRRLSGKLSEAARQFPIVVLTGPRQSGKTTLARAVFADLPYLSLESPADRRRALDDPRGFLADLPLGGIIDEIQHAPDLLSYLQGVVDLGPRAARWVLTGSQNLMMLRSVSQSLAGRAALLELSPFSYRELVDAGRAPSDLWEALWRGCYPPLYDRDVSPADWLGSYVATYVERDVRQILNVTDLATFQTFVALVAGRTGQLVNLSQLGSDAGISHNTARGWLSVLETGFICFRLQPFFRNLGKRLTKTPKLHFFDTGLVCYLLGIRTPAELKQHPLRGAVFETWLASEVRKSHVEAGVRPDLTFFRDQHGLEVDLLVRNGAHTALVEAKSGATVAPDAFESVERVAEILGRDPLGAPKTDKIVVHGGAERFTFREAVALPWREAAAKDWLAP